MISPPLSTLELVRHDATAQAPERDHAAIAPEYDRQDDALQVSSETLGKWHTKMDPRQRLAYAQRFSTAMLRPK